MDDREGNGVGTSGGNGHIFRSSSNYCIKMRIEGGVTANDKSGSLEGNVSVCSSLLVKMDCNSCRISEPGSFSDRLALPIVPRNPNSILVSDNIGKVNNLLQSCDDLSLG